MAPDLSAFDLTGSRALVTGSSRGIGRALVKALAAGGATVFVNGREAAAVESAVGEIRSNGYAAFGAAFDICDERAVGAAVASIERDHGPIDVLVNNAGIQIRKPFLEFPLADVRAVMEVNLIAAITVTKAVGVSMVANGRGKIVNVCSVQSELGRPSIVPYAASKGALKMFTRGLCAELGPHGIQVNALAPGYFDTELTAALVADATFSDWVARRTPAGRWGRVEELGAACVFLAGRGSDFVNGQILYVDGGMTAVV